MNIFLNKDGSGELIMHEYFPSKKEGFVEEVENEIILTPIPLRFTEDKVKSYTEYLEEEGLKVIETSFFEQSGFEHCYIHLHFKKVENLSRVLGFAEANIYFGKEDGIQKFLINKKHGIDYDFIADDRFLPFLNRKILKSYKSEKIKKYETKLHLLDIKHIKYEITVHFPEKVIEANSKIRPNDHTVTWFFNHEYFLDNDEIVLEATIKNPGFFNRFFDFLNKF